jgi:hypothetical protein
MVRTNIRKKYNSSGGSSSAMRCGFIADPRHLDSQMKRTDDVRGLILQCGSNSVAVVPIDNLPVGHLRELLLQFWMQLVGGAVAPPRGEI